jgi:hypothetical protein
LINWSNWWMIRFGRCLNLGSFYLLSNKNNI